MRVPSEMTTKSDGSGGPKPGSFLTRATKGKERTMRPARTTLAAKPDGSRPIAEEAIGKLRATK
ncbi:MAG: hypothetical protein IPP07_13195 [Holophagales bacterium]|nr:hypothetical protein [Holophagales bacterium]